MVCKRFGRRSRQRKHVARACVRRSNHREPQRRLCRREPCDGWCQRTARYHEQNAAVVVTDGRREQMSDQSCIDGPTVRQHCRWERRLSRRPVGDGYKQAIRGDRALPLFPHKVGPGGPRGRRGEVRRCFRKAYSRSVCERYWPGATSLVEGDRRGCGDPSDTYRDKRAAPSTHVRQPAAMSRVLATRRAEDRLSHTGFTSLNRDLWRLVASHPALSTWRALADDLRQRSSSRRSCCRAPEVIDPRVAPHR